MDEPTAKQGTEIELSIIAPAHNEQENVGPLLDEIAASLDPPGLRYEVVIVDDGSTDRTADLVASRVDGVVRLVRMSGTPPGRGLGQSAAFAAGIRASRGALIALLDADLQNDPADLPAMLEAMGRHEADMVQGDRSHDRRDTIGRRFGSWVGRVFRRGLLGDTIRDTGCSLRVMRREVAESIPLEFRGMHRYIPITARSMGYRVVEMPVRHRPRVAGKAKYGNWDRALVGLYDCLSVRWMIKRRRRVAFREDGPVERSDRSST